MNFISRAFVQGFQDGERGINNNTYKHSSKRFEYDNGYEKGLSLSSKKPIKKKPQQFDSVMGGKTQNIKIVISDGMIQDIVRNNANIELIVQDYDLDGFDCESDSSCKQDEKGRWYREIVFK
jgi:hypothetical protein